MQSWLDENGYRGFHVFKVTAFAAGATVAVNGATGAVWYHTWHGAFIDARTFLST